MSAGEPPPPLPGPGLDLPVDVNGDAVSSYGDRYVFNHWLELGGSLGDALLGAQAVGEVIDVSEFLSSPAAALSADSPLLAISSGEGAGWQEESGGSHIDFTRRLPPDIVPDGVSRNVRAAPDGAFFVFSSAADLGFGSNGKFQVYRVEVTPQDTSTVVLVSRDTQGNGATQNCEHPSISDDGLVVAFDTTAPLDPALDQNSHLDVYVRDFRGAQPVTRLVSRTDATGSAGDDMSRFGSVSGDGTVVAFTSKASDLIKGGPGAGCQFGPPCFDNVYRVGSDGVSRPWSS